MIKKIFILLKSIIKAKIIFKNPEQKDVIIFNSFQLSFYKALFDKTNYFCMQMPEYKVDKIYISFSILKLILLEFFNRNFKLSYYLALIKIVKPKMIITWIDNDHRFFNLAKILDAKIEFFAIQNAFRLEEHIRSKEEQMADGSKIYIPNYLCFGEQTVEYFKKIGATVKKFNIVGSLRLSNANQHLKKNNLINAAPKFDLCLISENLRHGMQEILQPNELGIIIKNAEKLAKKYKLRTVLVLKRPKDHVLYKKEINFYEKILDKNSPIIINNRLNLFSSYEAAYNSRLIIGARSSMLSELLAVGRRILSCNYNKDFSFNYPDFYDSCFAISDRTYDTFEKHVLFLLSMNQEDFHKHLELVKNHMVDFDENFSTFEKIRIQLDQVLKEQPKI